MSNISKADLKARLKGRNEDQKTVIKYFVNAGGCLSKTIKDADYDRMVKDKLNSMNFKQKALDKIGIDESEVNEIPPVNFTGYEYDTRNSYTKLGKDNQWRSSAVQTTWIFFSSTQIYIYQYTLNMDEDGKKETTQEYFYKDITNFSTSSDSIEKEIWDKGVAVRKTVDTERFAMVVPGDKFYCAMDGSKDNEQIIKAMKAKLREKKV